MIRQYTWLLASKYAPQDIPPSLNSSAVGNRMHVDHCIETVRLALMCAADVTPYLIEVDEGAPLGGRADFGAVHKCRDWGKIEGWIDENWEVV